MDKPIKGGCLCCTEAFRVAKTNQLKLKASKHQQKTHSRCYFKIRNKYLIQPINKERFKKVKKVKGQFILGPEITERIFSHLGVENLKICRLVSQSWNREACRLLRKRGNTTILNGKECWDFYRLLNNGRIMQLPSPFSQLSICIPADDVFEIVTVYLSFLKKYKLLKIRKLAFEDIAYGYRNEDYIEVAEKGLTLLEHCAPSLTHLRIMYWKLPSNSRETCNNLQFPQLEALYVKGIGAVNYVGHDDFPDEIAWLKNILKACPSLSRLYLQDDGNGNELIECDCFNSIQKLTILPDQLRTAVDVLMDPKTDLGSLSALDVVCQSLNERAAHESVMQALTRHADSLERLRWEAGKLPLKGEFPHCPKLTHIDLKELKLPQLNLTGLTALNSISFENVSFEKTNDARDKSDIRVCPSVEEVAIVGRADYQPLGPFRRPQPVNKQGWGEMFSNLVQCFPNADKWTIDILYVDSFKEVVLANQIRVKKLVIFVCSEQKSPVPDLSAFQDLEELGVQTLEEFDEGISEAVIRDQILKLPNLKILHLNNVKCVKDLLKCAKELAHLKIIFTNLNSRKNSTLIEAIFTHFPFAENRTLFDLNSRTEFPGSLQLYYMDFGGDSGSSGDLTDTSGSESEEAMQV